MRGPLSLSLSLGLEWRFRQTLSFSLNKRQLTSFSFLAFMHCVRLMCVSVCQAKPSNSSWHRHRPLSQNKQPTQLQQQQQHSISSDDDPRFKLCTESALIEVFLSPCISLSLPLLIVCWESVNCDSHGVPIACPDTPCDTPNTHIPYSISAYRLLFFTFFWPFVIDEGSFVLR